MYQGLASSADLTEHPREPKDAYEQMMAGNHWHAAGGSDTWFDDFSDNVCATCGPVATRKLMTNTRTLETRCLDCWGFTETWVG